MSEVILALLCVYGILNIIILIIALSGGFVEFCVSNKNMSLLTYKTIYDNTKLNKASCRTIALLFNLMFPMYNMGIVIVALVYYITHVGREGNFERD